MPRASSRSSSRLACSSALRLVQHRRDLALVLRPACARGEAWPPGPRGGTGRRRAGRARGGGARRRRPRRDERASPELLDAGAQLGGQAAGSRAPARPPRPPRGRAAARRPARGRGRSPRSARPWSSTSVHAPACKCHGPAARRRRSGPVRAASRRARATGRRGHRPAPRGGPRARAPGRGARRAPETAVAWTSRLRNSPARNAERDRRERHERKQLQHRPAGSPPRRSRSPTAKTANAAAPVHITGASARRCGGVAVRQRRTRIVGLATMTATAATACSRVQRVGQAPVRLDQSAGCEAPRSGSSKSRAGTWSTVTAR